MFPLRRVEAGSSTNTIHQRILKGRSRNSGENALLDPLRADLQKKYASVLVAARRWFGRPDEAANRKKNRPPGRKLPMFDAAVLKGKLILITGGGTGLGKEMAVGFATHGAYVYICGRRKEVLDQAVRDIRARSGGQASALLANVRDPDSIDAMMTSLWEEGPLTSLVNNAAANFLAPTESLSPRG